MTQKMMSDDISHLSLALSKFQRVVEPITKDKIVDFTDKSGRRIKYSYADLADIIGTSSKFLGEFELSTIQLFSNEGDATYLVTMLIHSSGQWIRSQIPIHTNQKLQELGSELTYLRRYSLTSILGIAAEEDEDGAIANEVTHKKPEKSLYIDKKQVEQLESMLVQIQDTAYEESMCSFFKVKTINFIKKEDWEKVLKAINKKVKLENEEYTKVEEQYESNTA